MGAGRIAAVAVTAALLGAIPAAAGAKPRLHAFASCSSFVHYARAHAPKELVTRGVPLPEPLPVVRTPAPNGVAAPQAESAPDYSTTNVQEAGVDEPDLVKTDGKTIFAAENGSIYALDARSDPPKLLGSLQLQGYGQQLLLSGDRLLVMSGNPIVYPLLPPVPAPTPAQPGGKAAAVVAPIGGSQSSTVTLVDVSDPSAMKVMDTMSVNGGFLDARMTGHTARVIFSATPRILPELEGAMPVAQRPQIARSTTPDWRPTYLLRHGRRGKIARHALVRCTAIDRPQIFSGLNSLTVLTIDIAKGLQPVDSDAIMTDGQTVYASQDGLYIATQKAIAEQPDAQSPPSLQTEIDKFDISNPDQTVYEGSGTVSGTLLNQYSMSEQNGYLRVASTDAPLWWSPDQNVQSQSFVTVLKQDGNALTQVGRVGNLGQGERIYAVRFLGDVGYVVTFRQVDPLYTIGLSDPTDPKVLGSVDLEGYSSYLHPVGDGLLLGIGSTLENNEPSGTQVSLFDVSDPAHPTRIANKLVGNGSSSDVQFDPHAFLWWDPKKLAVLPVQVYDYNQSGNGSGSATQFTGAIGFNATRAGGVTEAGRVSQPSTGGYAPMIDRSVVVGDRLFTISASGVMASDLNTFADRGFVAFPGSAGGGSGNTGSGTVQPGGTVTSPPAR